MKTNRSPWLHQLDKERKLVPLRKDIASDVVIIGAGIAGISTAYFILKNTKKSVVVLEKHKLAHGASGHNAGQVVSYFERPFYSIVEEFGIEMAAQAQNAIESAWDLLSDIYTDANLALPLSRFTGYDGFTTLEQVVEHLKNNSFRKKSGLSVQNTFVADNAAFIDSIPTEYNSLYTKVSHREVLKMLETEEKTFTAVSAMHKGTLNSALFCQEVANYLLTNYADRFSLYEGTNVKKIILRKDHAILDAESFTVVTPRVVLCTNGFENMDIFNHSGLDIDKHFHHEITGIVARMSGYLEKLNKPPMAISYYVTPELGFDNMEDPYFYFTRREYEYEKGTRHNLICIGGPQHSIADREEYLYEFDYPEEVQKEINEFVKKTYDSDPNHHIDYKFTWHGLMGYTRNRIRLIGEEKKNPVLMYNLGCNGVGILPSIFGGKRITDMIAGKKIVPMIFDPK